MKKEVQAVLNLIKDLGIEDDIFQALGGKSAKRSVVEVISKTKKTSNGYEIYYDERSNEVVGIVYKDLVFLKKTSDRCLTWFEAAEYCKSIIINGIASQFCPVDGIWKEEFKKISQDLCDALAEIGAEKLAYCTWCSEYSYTNAWYQSLYSGNVYNYSKYKRRYVRPVLVLNKMSDEDKSFRQQKTLNGYEIYYDESSNEAVGIVYKNRVFLKTTSSERINWHEAAEYCKSIIINGITSQFCPVDDNWKKEFCNVYQNLYQALKEIGAENLDYYTWCSEYDDTWAWTQRFSDGGVSYNFNKNLSYYVRPVLVL